jgi:hypothetical protein
MPDEPAPMTMEALEAIAKRAEDAAKAATDAASAGPAARAAAADEGAKQGWADMPKELLDGIAAAASAMTVSALRKEFEIQPPDPTTGGDSLSTAGSADGSPPTNTNPGEDGSSNTGTGSDDLPPAGKRTLASRILGF